MGKLMRYMIHCTDTAPWVKVNRATLYRWHLGPKKFKDGSVMYRGIKYPSMKDAPLEPLHENFVGNGWSKFGYSKLIHRDGTVEVIVSNNGDNKIDYDEMTWGCSGMNEITYHVALVGGKLQNNKSPKKHMKFFDLFTRSQFLALQTDIKEFLARHPHAKICGHYQYSKKKCSNFDVKFLSSLFELDDYFL